MSADYAVAGKVPVPCWQGPCPECGGEATYKWQPIADGRRQIRASCRSCNRFLGFAPHSPPFTLHANAARLAQDAEVWPAEALLALEKELQTLAKDRPGDPSDNVLHVGEQLLAVLRERPKTTVWIGVTDGEAGDAEAD